MASMGGADYEPQLRDAAIRTIRSAKFVNRTLQSICQAEGLPSTGVKAVLQSRICDSTSTARTHTLFMRSLVEAEILYSDFQTRAHRVLSNQKCCCLQPTQADNRRAFKTIPSICVRVPACQLRKLLIASRQQYGPPEQLPSSSLQQYESRAVRKCEEWLHDQGNAK